MYPVLRLSSEEESVTLNKISQLRVEIEYLKQLHEKVVINYSDAPLAENFVELIGQIYNLNIMSYRE